MRMPSTLFDRLLSHGYLPESVPPIFSTNGFAKFAKMHNGILSALSKTPKRLRGIDYSASKSGFRRRTFVIPHPIPPYFVSEFIFNNWQKFEGKFKSSPFSISAPKAGSEESSRAVEITPFHELHPLIHQRVGQFAF